MALAAQKQADVRARRQRTQAQLARRSLQVAAAEAEHEDRRRELAESQWLVALQQARLCVEPSKLLFSLFFFLLCIT